MSLHPGDTSFRVCVCAEVNASVYVRQRAHSVPANPSFFSWAAGAVQPSHPGCRCLLPCLCPITSPLLWLQAPARGCLKSAAGARWRCCVTGTGALQLRQPTNHKLILVGSGQTFRAELGNGGFASRPLLAEELGGKVAVPGVSAEGVVNSSHAWGAEGRNEAVPYPAPSPVLPLARGSKPLRAGAFWGKRRRNASSVWLWKRQRHRTIPSQQSKG